MSEKSICTAELKYNDRNEANVREKSEHGIHSKLCHGAAVMLRKQSGPVLVPYNTEFTYRKKKKGWQRERNLLKNLKREGNSKENLFFYSVDAGWSHTRSR